MIDDAQTEWLKMFIHFLDWINALYASPVPFRSIDSSIHLVNMNSNFYINKWIRNWVQISSYVSLSGFVALVCRCNDVSLTEESEELIRNIQHADFSRNPFSTSRWQFAQCQRCDGSGREIIPVVAFWLHYHMTLYIYCQLFLMLMMAMERMNVIAYIKTGWKRNYFLFQHFSLVSNLIPGSDMNEWMSLWVDDINYLWNFSRYFQSDNPRLFSWHEWVCRRHLSPAHKKSSMKICGIW